MTLRLVTLDSEGLAALDALETEVQALLPSAVERVGGAVAVSAVDAGSQASASAGGGDSVAVQVPGVTIEAEGDNATVRIPGISIDTDGGQSRVRVGGFSIRSDEAGDQVNISSDNEAVRIRAREEAVESAPATARTASAPHTSWWMSAARTWAGVSWATRRAAPRAAP
ncbi:hypothetical protein [Brevundimonas denitrificans]|uniref:hypothetical protein n=1 Tax=Brevundimonas denitrificans TaxID=1443434 RepID=UPI00223B48FB|nr:hypothetical protein [Brevundimonas denitrificans]